MRRERRWFQGFGVHSRTLEPWNLRTLEPSQNARRAPIRNTWGAMITVGCVHVPRLRLPLENDVIVLTLKMLNASTTWWR
jgi:hypothetical protein